MSRLPLLMSMPRLNPSLSRPLFSLLRTCCCNPSNLSLTHSHPHLSSNLISPFNNGTSNCLSLTAPYFSTIAAVSASTSSSSPSTQKKKSPSPASSMRKSKKARHESPENVLKHKLDLCSKHNNLKDALHLYEDARVNGVSLSLHHYNVLLYLCSNNKDSSIDGLERGFEIFRQMGIDKVAPNEATFTSLARMALAKEDPEMAFDLVKQMKCSGITPKLRSYGPALFGFCDKGDADRAFEVDAHMVDCGVIAEELELAALLKVSAETRRGDKVYEMLHRLRSSVRQVSEDTASILERWFESECASGVGVKNWDVGKVKEGVVRGGGGWHGLGWLGTGKWKVVKAEMDETGVCSSCGEKLVCIDIDPKETEDFATSLSTLACQKEKKTAFLEFQEWLKTHGPFDVVVDGANVGHIDTRTFNFRVLIDVVNKIQKSSPSKKPPLVILHRSRVYGGPAESPNTKRVLENWRKSGTLYATPIGSNDDWYWLYAAVSCKSLLVTNDEMRDHLFQLLGNSIFPRWKEKHQVRMTVSRKGLALHMPPPYSIVIQESEQGSWHVPTTTGDDLETPRQWLCATRASRTTTSRVRPQLSKLFSTR